MAITLTEIELGAALRLGDSDEELAEVTRLLAYGLVAVEKHAPDAPDAVQNEALIRLAGYLFDQPNAGRGLSFANAFRNSGAAAILLPYRIHRAGSTGDAVAAAQAAVGTASNPVVGVSLGADVLSVTFADGTTEDTAFTPGGGGVLDQTARDAAAAAQATADTAQSTADSKIDTADANALIAAHTADAHAHHTPPVGGGGSTFDGANLPGAPVAMRFGWAQTQTATDTVFTRASDHPIDGAVVGTSDGLAFPPFPPALNTDRTLYLHLWVEGSPDIASLAQAQGGLRLDLFGSHGALTVGGVAGTLYISNRRLPNPGATNSLSLVIVGDAIASQPWVEEQIAAIPAASAFGPMQTGTYTTQAGSGTYTATGITPGTDWILMAVEVSRRCGNFQPIFDSRPGIYAGCGPVDSPCGWLRLSRQRFWESGYLESQS